MEPITLQRMAEFPENREELKFLCWDEELEFERYVFTGSNRRGQIYDRDNYYLITDEQFLLYRRSESHRGLTNRFTYILHPTTRTLTISQSHDLAERSAGAAKEYNVEEVLLTSEIETSLTTFALIQASTMSAYIKKLEVARTLKVANNLQCRGLLHAAHLSFMNSLGVGKFSRADIHHRADAVAQLFIKAYFNDEMVKDDFGIPTMECTYKVTLASHPSTNVLIEQQKKLKLAVDLVYKEALNWLEGIDIHEERYHHETFEVVPITDELTATINAAIIANDSTLATKTTITTTQNH